MQKRQWRKLPRSLSRRLQQTLLTLLLNAKLENYNLPKRRKIFQAVTNEAKALKII
jgi:hypothetical protein